MIKCTSSHIYFSAARKEGYAIHIYTATESMVDSCLANADGDFLIVPQQGRCIEEVCTCALHRSQGHHESSHVSDLAPLNIVAKVRYASRLSSGSFWSALEK